MSVIMLAPYRQGFSISSSWRRRGRNFGISETCTEWKVLNRLPGRVVSDGWMFVCLFACAISRTEDLGMFSCFRSWRRPIRGKLGGRRWGGGGGGGGWGQKKKKRKKKKASGCRCVSLKSSLRYGTFVRCIMDARGWPWYGRTRLTGCYKAITYYVQGVGISDRYSRGVRSKLAKIPLGISTAIVCIQPLITIYSILLFGLWTLNVTRQQRNVFVTNICFKKYG